MQRLRRASTLLILGAALCAAAAAADTHESGQAPHDWGYSGAHDPSHWGAMSPEYAACSEGKQQSPIDIRHEVPADLSPITFDYHPSPLEIIDNGHTVQVNYGSGSGITVDGKRYELVQFHFHEPSEEHVHGHAYPMELHLVHKNADGRLAVVAVLLKEGKPNPTIETLWSHLPSEKGKAQAVAQVSVDASALLPAERGYYTYTGSLTTPPCSEGVTWLVFRTPVEVSREQVARFGRLYPNDARPVQPLNGRTVKVSR